MSFENNGWNLQQQAANILYLNTKSSNEVMAEGQNKIIIIRKNHHKMVPRYTEAKNQ